MYKTIEIGRFIEFYVKKIVQKNLNCHNAPDEDGKVPDYTLIKEGKTTLIVEAKNLSADLKNKKIINQLAFYCFNSGIDFGVLSNGVKWLLFKTFENNPKDRIVWQVDLE
jgi:predicted type IV restriction endonuclease